MRKAFLAVFSALFILGMALAASAEDAGYTVKGNVVSIDPEGKTMVLNTTEGEKTIVIQEGAAGFKDVKPGMNVELTCINQEGKACAKGVKIITAEEAAKPTQTFQGKIISIDSEGKTMVLRSDNGEEMTINVASTPSAEMPAAGAAAGAAAAPSEGAAPQQAQQVPLRNIPPGTTLRVDCMDVEGKFCAQRITIVPPSVASQPVEEYIGEVTSIDPEKKAVVVNTEKGVKTLYYQPTTTGLPLTGLETGSRIKAYCLDMEGKTCIRDINTAPAP